MAPLFVLPSLLLLVALLTCFLPRWLRRRPQDVPLLLLVLSLTAAVMAYAYPLMFLIPASWNPWTGWGEVKPGWGEAKLRVHEMIFDQQCAFALFIFPMLVFLWAKHRLVQAICFGLGAFGLVLCESRIEAVRALTVKWRPNLWIEFQGYYSWTGCFVLALLSFLAALGAVWGWGWFRDGAEPGAPLDLRELHRRGIISRQELEQALAKGLEKAA